MEGKLERSTGVEPCWEGHLTVDEPRVTCTLQGSGAEGEIGVVILLQDFAGIDVSRALLSAGPCPLCPGPGTNFHRYPVADPGAQFGRGVGSRPGRTRERRRFRGARSREIRGCYIAGRRPAGQSRALHTARRDPNRLARACPRSDFAGVPDSFRFRNRQSAGAGGSRGNRSVAGRAPGRHSRRRQHPVRRERLRVHGSGGGSIELCQARELECRFGPVLRHAAAIVRRFENAGSETGGSRGRHRPLAFRCRRAAPGRGAGIRL